MEKIQDLNELFVLQSNCFDQLEEYQNEFETMRLLYGNPSSRNHLLVEYGSVDWLGKLKEKERYEFGLKDITEKNRDSKNLRQEGNRLFTAKGDKQNVLGACRLYNHAIYAVLDVESNELPLAFANRAMALQSFGYYQQAYDDCCIALKLGYPKSLRHKIIMRQAHCAIKLEKLKKAEYHLNELKLLDLSVGLLKEFKELLDAFDGTKKVDLEENVKDIKQITLNRDTQEITTATSGRCMKTKCSIEKNQLIFTERASAFVAVGNTRRMCHQCGTLNFIPIPCLHCHGRVNYCSLNCQNEHFEIHAFECAAYSMQLFDHVGIGHLALRTILDNGLFAILDDLKLQSCISTIDVWRKLSEGGDIWKSDSIRYAESLRMISHLNKTSFKEIQYFVLVSHHLVVYLKYYTKYFDDLHKINQHIDWELLVASLLLRHIGQLICNGHTSEAIIAQCENSTNTIYFHMLNEKLWSSPWHLKLGCLHVFTDFDHIAALNLPYLSLCNHSCVQMIRHKFSGRFVSTYALRNIKQGEEITNCYAADYRNGKRKERREMLQETYYFDCQCENCIQTELEDKEFNEFYQYRCDNIECGKLFTSSTTEIKNSNALLIDLNLYCTVCSRKQTLKWLQDVNYLWESCTESKSRQRAYTIFKESEKYLVGLNKARCVLAEEMVHGWFCLLSKNYSLDDNDYCNLIELIKYILNVKRARSSVNSANYIIYMTFLWDLIAKRKYKCSKIEMKEMLSSLNIISDDLKIIFLNYYNDYIKEYLDM